MRHLGLLLALMCGGCNAPSVAENGVASQGAADAANVTNVADVPEDALARAGYQVAVSAGGSFTVAWRPVARVVPVNELFEIELLLFEGRLENHAIEKPLCGAKVQVSAWMPEHLHGMSRSPQAVETAPGRYLVRGLLLHMEGSWQLFVDVIASSGVSERTECALTLQ